MALINRENLIHNLIGYKVKNINIFDVIRAEPVVETVPAKRNFDKLIVENHNGKPYYSIQYEENGERHIGYSSYKLDCISDFLKEYFIPVQVKE